MKMTKLAVSVLSFTVATALAAPRLSVPSEGVAFGEIAAGEGASTSIELRNASSSQGATGTDPCDTVDVIRSWELWYNIRHEETARKQA